VVWPVDLSIVYLHPGGWPSAAVLAAAVLLAVVTALAWRVRRQIPAVAVGWLWFLGVLVPFIGIVQAGIQAMADRFAYLPIVGLFIAGIWGGRELIRCAPRARLVLGVTAGLVCAAAWSTASLQLQHWRNSVTLFRHAVAVDPENFIARNNLALALSLEGKLDEALVHVQQALRINPGTARPHNLCASILEQQGRLADALIHYQIASHLSPTWALAHLGAGRVLAALGRREQAIPSLRQALRLSPGDPEASALLAEQLAAEGQTAEAIQAYRTALQWSEDQPPVLNNLAWILATHPQAEFRQGHEAVRLAERACALSGRQVPLYLGTLAAAYAETSQFDQALRTAREARDKAAAAGQTELAARNAELLRHYETFQPYRQATP
jgi:tetratricopeptide (TPR) repeat protein